MTGRTRLEEHESRSEGRAPETPASLPGPPEALLALQRSAGNQATAAMLARMENDGDGGGQQGGGWYLNGAWLRGWLVYLRLMNPPAPPATAPDSDSESESESESGYETAPEGEPEVTAQTTAVTQQATAPSAVPSIAMPTASAPIGDGERRDLITQRRKLEAAAESADKRAARELRTLCYAIDGLLAKPTVADADLRELEQQIKAALEESRKQKGKEREKERVTSSSSNEAESGGRQLPVDVLMGGAMGDQSRWPNRDVLQREMTTMAAGSGVTLGTDGQPVITLGVRAHWQQAHDNGQHFVKVYIDEAEMGGGTRMRAYFRYRVVNRRLVLKLVAIREEHGGVNRTVVGNWADVISPDGT